MSAYFDQSHIPQILQATNIVDVVSNYVALKPKGREMVGLCPFHDDKRPSLNVNVGKQIFKCFACGAGGDAFKFMMLREKLSFAEAVCLLAERAGIKLPERRKETGTKVDRNELEKLNRWAARYYRTMYEESEEGGRARKYVCDRGISEETSRRFGLGWGPGGWDNMVKAAAGDSQQIDHLKQLGLVVEKEQGGYYDRFRERLIFPVIDAMGRVIAFGGRTLADDAAKYLNSPESVLFDKSRTLYGINTAKDAIVKERTAVVVEGYTDCIMAHQQGVSNVVATLGTALTTEHARVLSRYADTIVLVYDSDEAGQKAADRAIEIFFGQQIEVKLVTLPKGMDPCDYLLEHGKESFNGLIEGATEALKYKWRTMLDRLERADTVNGRKRALEEFLQLVAQAFSRGGMDAISRGFVLNQVAKLVEQPSEQVHKRVAQLERRLGRWLQPRESQEGKPMAASDSFNNSVRQIIEVLLNRPELYEKVRESMPAPIEITDEVLGPIADRVWEYCREHPKGCLAEILAGVESTELSRIMTDMALAGEARGNYEKTLADALSNLSRVRVDRERQELREQVSGSAEKYGEAAQTAMLLDIQSKIQEDGKKFPRFR